MQNSSLAHRIIRMRFGVSETKATPRYEEWYNKFGDSIANLSKEITPRTYNTTYTIQNFWKVTFQ